MAVQTCREEGHAYQLCVRYTHPQSRHVGGVYTPYICIH
jgi:hypothetical protein